MTRVHGWILFAVSVVGTAPAAADDYDLHFVANGSVGATDNVFAAPDDSTVGRDADVTYAITPGIIASYGTPRVTHELNLSTAFNGYIDHTEAWGLQLFGSYRAQAALTPLTDLSLSAGISRGTTNTLSNQTAANTSTAAPTDAGQVDQSSVRVDQAITYSFSPETRARQGLGASYTVVTDASDNDTGTLQLNAGVGADRAFQVSSAGIDAGLSYLSFDRPATATMPMPMPITAEPDRRADGRVSVRWRRDVSQRWSVGSDAGVVVVIPIDGDAGLTPVPVVGGTVSYVPQWGAATLVIARAVTANPFIAQQTVAESAALSLNLPLPWLNSDRPSDNPQWTASGSVGGARSRIIDTDSDGITGSFVNGVFDVALSFVPRDETTYALRYQYTRQKTLDAPVGMDGNTELPSLSQNSLLFTFTYRYPGRIVSSLPAREILRVDQNSTPLIERRGNRR
jgi:hypothetical protein